MTEETLDYLEQVLSGLRARFLAGDKSVEAKLRATAAKVDQLRLQSDMTSPQKPANVLDAIGQKLAQVVRRKSCCR